MWYFLDRVVPERLKRPDAADAEHDLLREPVPSVSAVEMLRERAVPLAVLLEVRVEEYHRHDVPADPCQRVVPDRT